MNRTTAEITPEQRRELDALPRLAQLPAGKLVSVSHRQLSLMAAIPVGSVGAYLARAGLRPEIPGSNVFRAGKLAEFCRQHAEQSAHRITLAVLARPGDAFVDPKKAADEFLAGLLNQAKQL
jgi:hypothetical protein